MLRCVWVGLVLCLVCQAETVKGDPGVERFWKRQIDADYRTLMSNPKKALKWTAPRLEISEAEALKGRGELESFAAENLPNAFRRYEKAKELATEFQQVFCEDFPEPEKIDERHPERAGFERVLRRLCEARGNFFRQHDEFAHYYLLKKAGVVSAEDLAKIDAAPIAVKLERENPAKAFFELPSGEPLPAKYAEFIQKYMPMTRMVYPRLEEERGLAVRLLGEMKTAIREMDIAREEPCRAAVVEKVEKISAELEEIRKIYLDHRTGDLDVDALAALDRKKGTSMKALLESLPGFVASVLARPSAVTDICGFRMVKIPGKDYWVGETEVTQGQWEDLMAGFLPKPFTDYAKPAYGLSLMDCWDFIFRLNVRPDVVQSGFLFRLPTDWEWNYACRAGAPDGEGLGRRRNGEIGPIDVMGWHMGNAHGKVQDVALKESNAWGLYDMHGNVSEYVGRDEKAVAKNQGGSVWDVPNVINNFSAGYWGEADEKLRGKGSGSEYRDERVGFRLLAYKSGKVEGQTDALAGQNVAPGTVRTFKLPGDVPMEMVYCPPGMFQMGSPETDKMREKDEVRHEVRLTKGFWMGKYEVTQKQWVAVMGDNPSYFKGDNHPVECVSWEQCQYFVKKLSTLTGLPLRLPTEAEWEYACRAGTTTDLPSGEDLVVLGRNNAPVLDPISWYRGNSSVSLDVTSGLDCSEWPEMQYPGKKAGTHAVGGKRANAWGLHDMIGNVWEWCSDWYNADYHVTVDPENTSSPQTFDGGATCRVCRGGSWGTDARGCRSACRNLYRSSDCGGGRGFRLCCSAGPRD